MSDPIFESDLPAVPLQPGTKLRAVSATGQSVQVAADALATAEQGEKADSALQDAPSDNKQYARKDGRWEEVAAPASGSVKKIETGAGLTGGPITEEGVIELAPETVAALALAETAVQEDELGTAAYADSTDFVAHSDIGAINGVAPLDADKKVPAAFLPDYVDDVLEFASVASFPVEGTSGKLYIAIDTSKSYRWGGSAYVPLSLAGVWRDGAAIPAAGLGSDGDYYLRTTNGDVYLKTAGAWAVVANIAGPKGDAGPAGSAWLRGSTIPSNSLGANGDYYLRVTTGTSNGDVYAKAAGAWTLTGNISGAKGDPGPKGDKGDVGPPGPSNSTYPTASFSGGAGPVEVGSAQSLFVPFGFTVTGCTLIADQVGTVQIDVRRVDLANYPPSSLDSICGGAPPTLANEDKKQVTDLSLWEAEVPPGSALQFICTACVGIKAATLTLTGFRS